MPEVEARREADFADPQSAEGNKLGVVAMGYDIKASAII
ncbi:hypothetical protein M2386_001089 [Erwinia rhapontici]|nr:hypothetical protein [Erwinia rhapontici]